MSPIGRQGHTRRNSLLASLGGLVIAAVCAVALAPYAISGMAAAGPHAAAPDVVGLLGLGVLAGIVIFLGGLVMAFVAR